MLERAKETTRYGKCARRSDIDMNRASIDGTSLAGSTWWPYSRAKHFGVSDEIAVDGACQSGNVSREPGKSPRTIGSPELRVRNSTTRHGHTFNCKYPGIGVAGD
jgi:hypothetical protein